MAASTRILGNHPNTRMEIVGTFAEVMAVPGPAGAIGIPSDVPGITMRHDGSAWAFGGVASVGSTAAMDALVSGGFRGQASVDGVVYAWSESLGRMVAQGASLDIDSIVRDGDLVTSYREGGTTFNVSYDGDGNVVSVVAA